MRPLRQRTNHVKYVLLDALSLVIAAGPVVASSTPMLGQEHIFRVEQVLDIRVLDGVDDPAATRHPNSSAPCIAFATEGD